MNEISVDKLVKLTEKLYIKGDRKSELWLGPPGIGKSDVVRQLAMRLAEINGKKFVEYNDDIAFEILNEPDKYFVLVDLRLTEVEPSDLIGIPRDLDGAVAYKPLLWARVLNKCAGILFLDELTNVQRPDVLSISYKLLLDRKAGFVPFHKDVLVIAAGNTPEHSAIANQLPAPSINRVRVFYVKPPRLEDWKDYMDRTYGDQWDKRVYAFLTKYTKFFLMQPQDVETLRQFATPRTWTMLATISKELSTDELEYVAIATVGEEAGAHFTAFCRIKVPDLEQIIMNPSLFSSLDEDAKYFVSVELSNKLTELIRKKDFKTFDKKYYNLMNYLLNNDKEFLVLSVFMMNYKDRVEFGKWLLMNVKRYQEFIKLFRETAKLKGILEKE